MSQNTEPTLGHAHNVVLRAYLQSLAKPEETCTAETVTTCEAAPSRHGHDGMLHSYMQSLVHFDDPDVPDVPDAPDVADASAPIEAAKPLRPTHARAFPIHYLY